MWHFWCCQRDSGNRIKVMVIKSTAGICLSSWLLPCHPWPEMGTQSHEDHLHLQNWTKGVRIIGLTLVWSKIVSGSNCAPSLAMILALWDAQDSIFSRNNLISTVNTTHTHLQPCSGGVSPSHCHEKVWKAAQTLSEAPSRRGWKHPRGVS